MDNESQVIHQQMAETRTALQDKLETLEQQVKETVQNATEAVTETVSTVKEVVHETVETVKESVQDTVETVKETFDLRQQVERHPWTMFFGAAAIGFIGGRLLERTKPRPAMEEGSATAAYEAEPRPNPYRQGMGNGANGGQVSARTSTSSQNWLDTLTEEYAEELNKVKGLAISTAGSLVGEILAQSAPTPLVGEIKEVVNGLTRKLGGHPLEGSLLQPSSATESKGYNRAGQEEPDETGPLGRIRREDEVGKRFDF